MSDVEELEQENSNLRARLRTMENRVEHLEATPKPDPSPVCVEVVRAAAREELLLEMSNDAKDAGWWLASRGDSGGEAGMVYEWVDGYRALTEGEG